MEVRKIDAMIIGAQKAGTTAFSKNISEHPGVLSHPQIEFSYFRDDKENSRPYAEIFAEQFTKGESNAKLVLAKNVGVYSSEIAIKRLHEHNPECKLIFFMREPVARAISSYNMEVFNGWLKNDISEIEEIAKTNNRQHPLFHVTIMLGEYARHLKNIYKYFPKDQVKLYLYDDLKHDPKGLFRDCCQWLGIDPDAEINLEKKHYQTRKARSSLFANYLMKLRNPNNPFKRFLKRILPYSVFISIGYTLINLNKSSKKPDPVPDKTKAFLFEYFHPLNQELAELIQRDLSAWKK